MTLLLQEGDVGLGHASEGRGVETSLVARSICATLRIGLQICKLLFDFVDALLIKLLRPVFKALDSYRVLFRPGGLGLRLELNLLSRGRFRGSRLAPFVEVLLAGGRVDQVVHSLLFRIALIIYEEAFFELGWPLKNGAIGLLERLLLDQDLLFLVVSLLQLLDTRTRLHVELLQLARQGGVSVLFAKKLRLADAGIEIQLFEPVLPNGQLVNPF